MSFTRFIASETEQTVPKVEHPVSIGDHRSAPPISKVLEIVNSRRELTIFDKEGIAINVSMLDHCIGKNPPCFSKSDIPEVC